MRSVVDALMANEWSRSLQVNGVPLAKVAEGGAWLELAGDGPFASRTLAALAGRA